ncbi:hypothetical protein ADM96_26150 [Burkholderia sp. ST111]|nr:hypothetical protein ADM96_26150 [Burkholderia sp. ST111]
MLMISIPIDMVNVCPLVSTITFRHFRPMAHQAMQMMCQIRFLKITGIVTNIRADFLSFVLRTATILSRYELSTAYVS